MFLGRLDAETDGIFACQHFALSVRIHDCEIQQGRVELHGDRLPGLDMHTLERKQCLQRHTADTSPGRLEKA